MKQKVETLQADLSRRQESYIRRERAFNMRIEELEEEVGSLKVRSTATTTVSRILYIDYAVVVHDMTGNKILQLWTGPQNKGRATSPFLLSRLNCSTKGHREC